MRTPSPFKCRCGEGRNKDKAECWRCHRLAHGRLRNFKTATCGCGQPMHEMAKQCFACYDVARRSPLSVTCGCGAPKSKVAEKCAKCDAALRHERRRRLTCRACGKAFYRKSIGRRNKGLYCTRACAFTDHQAWRSAKQLKQPMPPKPRQRCIICGSECLGRRTKRCSEECEKEYARRWQRSFDATKKKCEPTICPSCGETFVPVYGSKRRIYCSDLCGRGLRKYGFGKWAALTVAERNALAPVVAGLKAMNRAAFLANGGTIHPREGRV
jgi:hypothetical protein